MSDTTTKVGYTPGPWKFKGEQLKHDSSRVIYGADGHPCAAALDFNLYSRDAEADANARLIAQAPAMAELLRQIRRLTIQCPCSLLERDSGHRSDCRYPEFFDAKQEAADILNEIDGAK